MGQMLWTEKPLTTSSLPRGDSWSWNQSRARQTIKSLHGNITVCFYKLSTRRIPRATETPPLIKLWIFNVTIPILGQEDKCVNFLWCERGQELHPTKGSVSTEHFMNYVPPSTEHAEPPNPENLFQRVDENLYVCLSDMKN